MARPTNQQIDYQNALLLIEAKKKRELIENSERSLRQFVRLAWPIVEPGTPFVDGWHIDAICDHLQAVIDGQIKNLLINVPPRTGKSTIFGVMLPAWAWIGRPEIKWLYTSFSLELSMRDSVKCRELIKSDWYQKYWGSRFSISKVQDAKNKFVNDKAGYRVAVSVEAGTTGDGGTYVCYDDLNDIAQMTSKAYIDNTIYYHDHVMQSRLNDERTGGRISIQQRSGENDITGHILSKEFDWEHLVIPMEFEAKRRATSIGWTDPRTVPGEPMCLARFSPLQIEKFKRTPMLWAGQYQQRPAPAEGALFKREWWRFYNEPGIDSKVRVTLPGGVSVEHDAKSRPERFEQIVHGWDMSFKDEKSSDFVSGHVWGRIGSNVYLLARRTERMDFPATIKAVREMSRLYPCPEKMVEDKANGPAVIQTLRNEIPGMIASQIQGGLESLATSSVGYVEAGNMFLPNPHLNPWVWDFIEQFANYPHAKHDDDVSAASHAWRRLFNSLANTAAPEFRVTPRVNEPATAQHVADVGAECQPQYRRWIAVAPGKLGAALFICQLPSKALRVYREVDISNVDAHEAGRRIAEASIPDIQEALRVIHVTSNYQIDVVMQKECFAAIEPIGCYAELLEAGMTSWEPTEGEFAERQAALFAIKQARFSPEMVELEDSCWDHLRELLRFAPADFKEIDYNRDEAFGLYRKDPEQYRKYMAAVQGEVRGEYPRIKFATECGETIRAMGSAVCENVEENPFLRALLVGISAADTEAPKLAEVPWSGSGPRWQPRNRRRQRLVG